MLIFISLPPAGRCPFQLYIPRKPVKYGIKSWVACDSRCNYAWKIQLYTGQPDRALALERYQGQWVMFHVTKGLEHSHNVTCGNFFTSYELGRLLLERGLTLVGTVHKNRPEDPPTLLATDGSRAMLSKFALMPFVRDHQIIK